MKAIAVYSGKGGVGKTTISALLALALAKNHKVALLDMDLQNRGELVLAPNSSNPRYIPAPNALREIECAFGHLVSTPASWEQEYTKLGVVA